MNRQNAIEIALETLEKVESDLSHPAAMIVLPPDVGFISGNTNGFVQLAISSLKAAKGDAQSFKGLPWVGAYEDDWILRGLTPDESAQIHLRPAKSKRSWIVKKMLLAGAALLCIFLCACMSVGALDIFHTIFRR